MIDLTTLTDAEARDLLARVYADVQRRDTIASAPVQAEALAATYAAATADQPADDWDTITATTDRIGPGRRVVLDGIEYRNKSGAWLPVSAGPEQDPHSIWWERVTPPEPEPGQDHPANYKGEWSPDARYEVGDVVSRNGRYWRCLVGHGAEYQGQWAPGVAHTVWTDIGPTT